MPFKKAGESRAFGAPGKYIQGPGELDRLPMYAKPYGDQAFLLLDPFFRESLEKGMKERFRENDQKLNCEIFQGECALAEIEGTAQKVRECGADVMIGIGGGKTCDTTKAVAAACGIPMIICPTAISNDAPTSSHSVVYRQDHTCFNQKHIKNPEYVIVDTDIVIKAPLRMFAAGVGDALATYIEARAALACDNINYVGAGYRQTKAGIAIAQLAYELILSEGREAYLAAKLQVRTEAFENLVEANTLLSGLGFENTGCSIAHGLHNALHEIPETARCLHGELVAFGVLVQLIVENRMEEFKMIRDFFRDLGLPASLDEIGIVENKDEKIQSMIECGWERYDILQVEPFSMTKERLKQAVLFVDEYEA